MRRTDRLFELIQILRDGRLHTARDMAARLEVSTRTLLRDMATLIASGLPVEGERGVGYILREPVTLPPLTLTPDEVQALTLGLQLVTRGADPSLTRAADSLLGKVSAVLPARLLQGMGEETWVFPGAEALAAARHLPALRRAIRLRERMVISYVDGEGAASDRPVRPLVLEFWGRVWTLAAWCETRDDFRSFRVDRIDRMMPTGETFPEEPGRTVADWRRLASG
ncbi:MAG: YafY family protein [Tabrizicola sp.]|uniref:helix-turn-helix transcriptional regulator n=1 Tax=Tabrizicola sp. TaxID=2005166 RepID=UPI002ABB7288|nr:YafY family protein [Tabrizicola sp.]MDZ4086682.1 YafY family protein [Tabrizicola sp.]